MSEPTKLPANLDPDTVLEAAQADSNTGFCLNCGAEQDGCEPDARKYTCETCGEKAVYGAEEILVMGLLS